MVSGIHEALSYQWFEKASHGSRWSAQGNEGVGRPRMMKIEKAAIFKNDKLKWYKLCVFSS